MTFWALHVVSNIVSYTFESRWGRHDFGFLDRCLWARAHARSVEVAEFARLSNGSGQEQPDGVASVLARIQAVA